MATWRLGVEGIILLLLILGLVLVLGIMPGGPSDLLAILGNVLDMLGRLRSWIAGGFHFSV